MTTDIGIRYGFGRHIAAPYERAIEMTKEALKEQGFGVLAEIDVRRTLKEKRGVDIRPYLILGACNPPLAQRAIEAEPDIGLLLPCNVVVRVTDEGTLVEIADPEVMLGIVGRPDLADVAREATTRLHAALDRVVAAGAE